MKFRCRALSGILLGLLPLGSVSAERPFEVENPLLLEENEVTVSVGMRYRDEVRDFGQPLRDHQYDVPRLRVAYGLGGRAEIRLEGDAWRFAQIDGNSVNDAGDWTLSTKIRLTRDDPQLKKALAGIVAIKLPNASNEEGLGTDETDVFFGLVGSCTRGDHEWRASATLGILGDPTQGAAQNDVGIFGLAWSYLTRLGHAGVELRGQTGPAENDDPMMLRLLWSGSAPRSPVRGRISQRRWEPFAGVGIGLNDDADRGNLELGVRFRLRAGK